MNFEQLAILLLLVCILVIFALDRVRMEIVAIGGLAVGVMLGAVEPAAAFSGLSDPTFVTVVEILLIVKALGRSGILDPLAHRIPKIAETERGILVLLCLVTAGLSIVMNNIGALALMLPIVVSTCRIAGIDQRRILMPVSFAALLGGTCSVIGTPANLVVSQNLAQATGRAFAFFDFAWVGVPATIVGLLVLFATRGFLSGAPGRRSGRLQPRTSHTVTCEVEIPAGSRLLGTSISEYPARIHSVKRDGAIIIFQFPASRFEIGDLVLLDMPLEDLETLIDNGTLALPGPAGEVADAVRIQAVVMPESTLVGSHLGMLASLASRGVTVIAAAVRAPHWENSFADIRLAIGDVIYLSGTRDAIRDAAEESEILLLGQETEAVAPHTPQRRWTPPIVFAAGVIVAAFGLARPEYAFGLAVLGLALCGTLDLRRGIAELDWPILVMLATLIPLGMAVETTGAAAVLADRILALLPSHSPLALAALMLVLALVVTPFVNNASTAIILAPIAMRIAAAAGVAPEPLLIAVALGASIDFLTPIGHHNNTIVMGLAGYRFSDFLRAGWPLTITVSLAAILAISLAWT